MSLAEIYVTCWKSYRVKTKYERDEELNFNPQVNSYVLHCITEQLHNF